MYGERLTRDFIWREISILIRLFVHFFDEQIEEKYHQALAIHANVKHEALLRISAGILSEEDAQHGEQEHEESGQEHMRVLFLDPQIDPDAHHEEYGDHVQHLGQGIGQGGREIRLGVAADRTDGHRFGHDRKTGIETEG